MSEKFATALDSLGEILPTDPGRDAIHLATHAVTSEERLFPGQHIGLTGGKASTSAEKLIGIVDPFLPGAVHPGQMFWLVLYPRTITSLRHVWTHPDFSAEPVKADARDVREASKQYLEDFADRLFSYEDEGSQLQMLIDGIEGGGSFGTDIEYGPDLEPSDELYRHYAIYTGKEAPVRPEYFRCAC